MLPTFTSWTQLGIGLVQQRLDWLFSKGVTPVAFEVRQDILVVDHVPVMADLSLL
jgi:endonuclease/exonuclease/phosphatase (EEP) superfamily protein YafD